MRTSGVDRSRGPETKVNSGKTLEADGSEGSEPDDGKTSKANENETLKFSQPIDVLGRVGAKLKYQQQVPITLDSGAGVDLVGIDFVHQLGLEPCTRAKHQHQIPDIYAVGHAQVPQFGIYHLRVTLTDRFGRETEFIRPFLAVKRDTTETKLLLGMATLEDLRILIDAETRDFEFKTTPQVQVCSARAFQTYLTPNAYVYGILPVPSLDSLLSPEERRQRITEYNDLPL